MTQDEVAVILSLAAALDPRFNTVDRDQAQARVVAWTDALEGVAPRYALDYVRRYYRTAAEWPLRPGVIRQAWLADQRREAHRGGHAQGAIQGGSNRLATEDRPPELVEAFAEVRRQCEAHTAQLGYATGGGPDATSGR